MVAYFDVFGKKFTVDHHPYHCPLCHSKIIPKLIMANQSASGKITKADLEVCYQCPNLECEELFISYFHRNETDVLTFRRSLPFIPEPAIFADPIKDISYSFCEIYDEAQKAEQFGLTQVCGVGYRKALEFLIKDYSIRNNSAEKSVIEASFLGKCINVYVTDPKIKQVAERAVWLGNDETHYQRRWVGKDLHDLKVMIRLVLHWIEAEHLTAEALNSMPPP